MRHYRITPEARDDLQGIARYTKQTWGSAQANIYRDQLIARFTEIARDNYVHRHFSKALPEVCVTHCEHHFVFYLQAQDKTPASIIAVLHENMDLVARLKNRL